MRGLVGSLLALGIFMSGAHAQPKPEFYGVYAQVDGKLIKLAGRPVSTMGSFFGVSGIISHPPSNTFNTGNVRFVIFRRELTMAAPESMFVSIVARIAREKSISPNGRIDMDKPIFGKWNLRSRGYKFLVAPYGDSKEMVLVRHEAPDFRIPDGRYAIAFGDQYYDFMINRENTTDPEHCVEWVARMTGLSFPPCGASGASLAPPAPSPAAPPRVAPAMPPAAAGAPAQHSSPPARDAAKTPKRQAAISPNPPAAPGLSREAAFQIVRSVRSGCTFADAVVVHSDPEWQAPVPYAQIKITLSRNIFGSDDLAIWGNFDPPYSHACPMMKGSYDKDKPQFDRMIRALRALGMQVYLPEGRERDITGIK